MAARFGMFLTSGLYIECLDVVTQLTISHLTLVLNNCQTHTLWSYEICWGIQFWKNTKTKWEKGSNGWNKNKNKTRDRKNTQAPFWWREERVAFFPPPPVLTLQLELTLPPPHRLHPPVFFTYRNPGNPMAKKYKMTEALPLLFVPPTYPPTSAITQPTLNYRKPFFFASLYPPHLNEMPNCIIYSNQRAFFFTTSDAFLFNWVSRNSINFKKLERPWARCMWAKSVINSNSRKLHSQMASANRQPTFLFLNKCNKIRNSRKKTSLLLIFHNK